MKVEQEFNITHSQFVQGMADMIKMTKKTLEIFKKAYIRTKDPYCKAEMEKYTNSLVDLVRLLKSYTVRIENGIGVNPLVVFRDGRTMFGYRMKAEVDFSKKWFEIIAKKINGREMVI